MPQKEQLGVYFLKNESFFKIQFWADERNDVLAVFFHFYKSAKNIYFQGYSTQLGSAIVPQQW